MGGCTRTKRHLQDLLSYNPVTGEWSILATMLVPRSQMGVAVLDKHLYVVGGITNNNEVLNLVEQYDFEEVNIVYKSRYYFTLFIIHVSEYMEFCNSDEG